MTEQRIDTEALRASATAAVEAYGPDAWPDIRSADLLTLLDRLAAAEHRAARTAAQSEIRGRAVIIARDRARQAEAERDEWRQTALDERAAALDTLEQLTLRYAQIQVAQTALTYRPEETP